MKIEKIKKQKNNVYQILLSDNTSLSFYDDVIIKYNLLVNKEFDQKKLKEMLEYNKELSAYYGALSYLKAKLRTKKEINDKLKKLGYSKEIISGVIKKLTDQKYLNDELYIKSYIADQVNLTLKGPKKIKYELEKLGFKDIDAYLINYDTDGWLAKINKIIAKKIKSNHNLANNYLLVKIKNDLSNLGYPEELINEATNNFTYPSDTPILEKEFEKLYRKLSQKYQGDTLKYKLKDNLYRKGFSSDAINKLIDENFYQ